MSSALGTTYSPRPGATPEGEITALANVYSFVLRCGEARRAEEEKWPLSPPSPTTATTQRRSWMIAPPQRIIHDPNVLPAVRELISNSPEAACCGAETVAELLYTGRFLPYRPAIFAVEAALEALRVEGEILS